MKKTDIRIRPNGKIEPIAPANLLGDDTYSLEELQTHVLGFIQMLPTTQDIFHVIGNEEASIQNLPVNEVATALAGWTGIGPLYGTIIFVHRSRVV